jgi:hypothetical protein
MNTKDGSPVAYVGFKDVAKACQVSYRTVLNWHAEGVLSEAGAVVKLWATRDVVGKLITTHAAVREFLKQAGRVEPAALV